MLSCLRSPRIGEITRGYFLATGVAGFAISVILALFAAFSANPPTATMLGTSVLVALMVSAITIPYTFLLTALPAAGIIAFAELRSIRSPLFYAAMGVLAAAAAMLTVTVVLTVRGGASTASYSSLSAWAGAAVSYGLLLMFFALPGVLGGLTYWAKAGCDAGCAEGA